MAKHNNVYLYGWVYDAPKFTFSASGEATKVRVSLLVARGARLYESEDIKGLGFDRVRIVSGNPRHIASIQKWQKGDMVYVKGALTTKNLTKKSPCPYCGEKNEQQGMYTFVSPIYTKLAELNVDETDAKILLKESCEISNQAHIIGAVCQEPRAFITSKGLVIANYQLAVSRKFRVIDDVDESRVDFPWVKAYGKVAEDDRMYLKKGSFVLMDGVLQEREVKRPITCAHCGRSYEFEELVMDLVPYSTEYLRNYKSPDDISEDEKEHKAKEAKYVKNEKEIDMSDKEPPAPTELYNYLVSLT